MVDLRNKLAFTLAHLFINVYPSPIPNFLHSYFDLFSSTKDAALLGIHLLSEIAQEIHDSTMRSAREWDDKRQMRDGMIRDAIRTSGDETRAVSGLLRLAEGGGELAELALRTLSTWTRELILRASLRISLGGPCRDSHTGHARLLQTEYTSFRVTYLYRNDIQDFYRKGEQRPD
jgi:exportin-T